MYIEPNSKIYICANVPIDEKHDNTILFNSASEQIAYINNYFIKTFDKYSYQRIKRGYIKVECTADEIYGANYMTFQNTAYGSKWFFAFIKGVDYINDNVAQVNYEIDPVQTYMFDWTLHQCFVEREHSVTDFVGDNLVPENLGTGEIMYANKTDLFHYDNQSSVGAYHPCVVVACPFAKDGTDSYGSIVGSLYTGLHYNIFSDNEDTQVTLLQEITNFFNNARVSARSDEIVTMFYFIKEFGVASGTHDTPLLGLKTVDVSVTKDYSGFKNNYNDANETAYIPHNNKLHTAPYNYISITDWQGNSMDLFYEYFYSPTCDFKVMGTLTTEPSIAFAPMKYMGKELEPNKPNFDYTFWFKDFPKVPWNSDGFIAWLAQTGVAVAGKLAGDFIGSGSTGFLGTMGNNWSVGNANEAASFYNRNQLEPLKRNDPQSYGSMSYLSYEQKTDVPIAGNLMASGAVAALRGRRIGGVTTPAPNWGMNNVRVSAVNKKIRKEWAERIDSYFDMFGYATMKVKVPNISSRPSWNYVKTIGCELSGNIPADDVKAIKSIFDKGIRFWKPYKTVGDYTQANQPI